MSYDPAATANAPAKTPPGFSDTLRQNQDVFSQECCRWPWGSTYLISASFSAPCFTQPRCVIVSAKLFLAAESVVLRRRAQLRESYSTPSPMLIPIRRELWTLLLT